MAVGVRGVPYRHGRTPLSLLLAASLLLASIPLSLSRDEAERFPTAADPTEAGEGKEKGRKNPHNSFLPFVTAVSTVVYSGDGRLDSAMQHGVACHAQGDWPHALGNYTVAASLSPTNRDAYIGASYAFRENQCHDATRALRTYLRLHREQGRQPRRDVRCRRAPTHQHANPMYQMKGGAAHASHVKDQYLRVWVDNGPYVSASTFRGLATHVHDEFYCHLSPHEVEAGDVVFVNTFLLCPFLHAVHPRIRRPYYLLTHNSDFSAPRMTLHHDYASFLSDPRILGWFTQNPTSTHPRLHPLPQGFAVDPKTWASDWSASKVFDGAMRDYSQPDMGGRTHWLYVNFAVRNHEPRRAVMRWATDPKQQSYVTAREKGTLTQEEYRREAAKHRYIFCPPGNGLDTHRTYESLQMGAVPVLLSTNDALDALYTQHLPLLVVSELSQLSQAFLEAQHPRLRKAMQAMWHRPESNPLTQVYWENHVQGILAEGGYDLRVFAGG